MGLFGWMREHTTHADNPGKQELAEIAELAERVTRLNPRLRLVSHHERKLRPALAQALTHVRTLVRDLPAPREASDHAWGIDPCIHAFFGTPHDVALTFSRSTDLRDYFGASPARQTATAVLGMTMTERRTLGVALEGDVMRSEVPQTHISFGEHRVTIIADTDAALRDEIVRRMFDQLALESLARFTAGQSHRDALDREHGFLVARLRLFERQGTGMRSVVCGDGPVSATEAASLREQIAANEQALAQLPAAPGTLERQLECLAETLADAPARFSISRRPLRLSATNVLLASDDTAPASDIELLTAHVPGDPPLVRAFALVTFARGDMVSPRALLDEAERHL